MHEAERYGYLLIAGIAPAIEALAALVGSSIRDVKAGLAELERAGVFSRDDAGVIYSRRMVRDKAKADQDRVNGKGGGNPKLAPKDKTPDKPNGGGGVNPPDKAQKPEARGQNGESSPPSSTPTSAAARKVADFFTGLRDELWPGAKPLTVLTLVTEGQQFIDGGGSETVIDRALERGLRKAKADGKAPPSSLRAFSLSIQDAIASERNAGRSVEGGIHPDGERNRWAFRVRSFRETGFWLPDWGGKPGEPDCQAPRDLIETGPGPAHLRAGRG